MSNSFNHRALLLIEKLKANEFPNAVSLAEVMQCSRNTAMRVIDRLRYEYGVPIEYSQSDRGYYLTDPKFEFKTLPPGKDELAALVLLRDLANVVDSKEIADTADIVWRSLAKGNLVRDLKRIGEVFSCELTQVADLADNRLIELVTLAERGEFVSVSYISPWRSVEPRDHIGRILHVHYSDGSLYCFLHEERGRGMVLNASFIKSINILDNPPQLAPLENGSLESWRAGFGVWAHKDIEEVVIEILPPASEYYAAQKWHPFQVDERLEDGTLRRALPSALSPELIRRLLSIGGYLKNVSPEPLSNLLKEEIQKLTNNLNGTGV